MKKIILTVLLSSLILLSFAVADYVVNKDFTVVKIQNVTSEKKYKYIKADGVVSELNNRDITIEYPFKTEKIYVKVGDSVIKNQKLIMLDKDYLKNKAVFEWHLEGDALNNIIAGIDNHNSYIESPINGVITSINTKEGAILSTLNPVISVSDLENLIISSFIPESIISNIYQGQNVQISGKAFEGIIDGKVIKIYPTAEKNDNNAAQTFIRVDIHPEKNNFLKPGINVELEFEKSLTDNSLIIPFDSVMFDENNPYVYINRMGYAVKKYVNLGEEFETDVEILDGISENDMLILNPKIKNLKNGSKLSVITESK